MTAYPCHIPREHPCFVELKGLHHAFFMGPNTSCRVHICGHYEVYKECCKVDGIKMKEYCIPHNLKATRDLSGTAELPLLKRGQLLKDFCQHREHLAHQDKTQEAEDWQSELRLYLKVVVKDVDDEMDVVEWWQVCPRHCISIIPVEKDCQHTE